MYLNCNPFAINIAHDITVNLLTRTHSHNLSLPRSEVESEKESENNKENAGNQSNNEEWRKQKKTNCKQRETPNRTEEQYKKRNGEERPYRSKVICRDFIQGRCKRGTECKYRHTKMYQEYCRDERMGNCQWGVNCRYAHRSSDYKNSTRNWKQRWDKNQVNAEMKDVCWYYQEGERCPFGNTRNGCKYRCYNVYRTTQYLNNLPENNNMKANLQKENLKEIGEVRQKLNFLEERLTTVMNHLTWAQRVQGSNPPQKNMEETHHYRQIPGMPDPNYGIGITRGH